MATTRKGDNGRLQMVAYTRDKKIVRLIERGARLDNRPVSEFLIHHAGQAALRLIDERKALAAERQFGEERTA